MTWPTEALITAGVAVVASILTWITARGSQTQTLLTTMMNRITALETRVNELEDKRRADAILIRRQGDHIDTLEDHIRAGKPPPPPERPDGI